MSFFGSLINSISPLAAMSGTFSGGQQSNNPMSGMGGMGPGFSPALNGISSINAGRQQSGNNQGGGFWQGLKNFTVGTPGSIEGIQNFDPDQLSALQWLLSNGLQGLQDPYAGFQGIEDYARSNFQNKTIPSLAERLSSVGRNALSSPDFAAEQFQAGKDLEIALAAMRSQYGMQNRQQQLGQIGMGLTPRYQNFSIPGQQGFLQNFLQDASKAGLQYLSGGMGS